MNAVGEFLVQFLPAVALSVFLRGVLRHVGIDPLLLEIIPIQPLSGRPATSPGR